MSTTRHPGPAATACPTAAPDLPVWALRWSAIDSGSRLGVCEESNFCQVSATDDGYTKTGAGRAREDV